MAAEGNWTEAEGNWTEADGNYTGEIRGKLNWVECNWTAAEENWTVKGMVEGIEWLVRELERRLSGIDKNLVGEGRADDPPDVYYESHTWEHLIETIITVQPVDGEEEGDLEALVKWKGGWRTWEPTDVLKVKAPVNLMVYYESILRFTGEGARCMYEAPDSEVHSADVDLE
ncbi:hypothetical protein HK104_006009, partial [Borealophlyctis nickersoniae]